MDDVLISRARAILAQPKHGVTSKPNTEGSNPASETKVPGLVHVPTKPIIEPAVKPDGSPLSVVFWETGDGRILGPAIPEFLAKGGDSFWVSTTFEGRIWWINADRLRSKKQFEQQRKPQAVERIKELH